MVCRYFIYEQTLLVDEARRLVEHGMFQAAEDICILAFHELHDVVRNRQGDQDLIARRQLDFRRFGALRPPRVLTPDGEALNGTYRRDGVPTSALVGRAVSGGTVEGRARVVHDTAEADLEPCEIFVTPPPQCRLVAPVRHDRRLVTEAGGLMTHGAPSSHATFNGRVPVVRPVAPGEGPAGVLLA
jgi:rifampicin phosphotransferase